MTKEELRQAFEKCFGKGGEPVCVFSPGRVNLIGEHTDYNGGHVFPCALTIGNQSILIGLCYANGLSPITGKYGVGYGALAAGLHYLLVSAVPDMHGGFLLYNGGFTAALICILFVPQLEKFTKTKEERKAKQTAEVEK